MSLSKSMLLHYFQLKFHGRDTVIAILLMKEEWFNNLTLIALLVSGKAGIWTLVCSSSKPSTTQLWFDRLTGVTSLSYEALLLNTENIYTNSRRAFVLHAFDHSWCRLSILHIKHSIYWNSFIESEGNFKNGTQFLPPQDNMTFIFF